MVIVAEVLLPEFQRVQNCTQLQVVLGAVKLEPTEQVIGIGFNGGDNLGPHIQ